MDAGDLQGGFRLGDWLVEPLEQRIVGRAGTFVLPEPQVQLLLCLAEHHGEEVGRRVLTERAWPGDPQGDARLATAIADIQAILGDAPAHPHHLVPVGDDGYALIAHVEPLPQAPATGRAGTTAGPIQPRPRQTFFGRVQRLVAELQRRQVFKVAASYLVGMWIVLQVAEVTFAPLHFPGWWTTALTILAILGLPIVVSLAWTYEITPTGIVVDGGDTLVGVKLPRARRAVAPVIVAGVTAMAGITGLAWWRSIQTDMPAADATAGTGVPSIAVLPLVDMSPGGGNGYLGDGLSEELSMRLAQVPGLRVASRTSAFEFKGRSEDVRKIGQALGVRNVIEGSVRRDGDSLRVTVQLIDARTGYHVWAGNFDRSWREVLVMQDEVARSVTEALKIVLDEAEPTKPAVGLDARAIDPYLTGLALLRQSGDKSRLDEAARQFQEAVRITPSFARAHAGLCQVGAGRYKFTRDPADLQAAESACKKALALSPSLVESEKALAALYVSSGRFAPARAIYQRLIERDPRSADGFIGLAKALEGEGNLADAEANLRHATLVEPAFWGAYSALGGFYWAHGRIDEAAATYRRVTELVPTSASALNNLGASLLMKGDVTGAMAVYQRSLGIEPSRSAYSNLGTCYYYMGRAEDATEAYSRATELASQDYSLWGNLADAQWQVPSRRDAAPDNYRRAIRLAERDLEVSGREPMLLAQLGYYLCRIGECTKGDGYLQEALKAGGDQMYVHYYAALAAADRGDAAGVARATREALRLGYPKVLLNLDPVLKPRIAASGGPAGGS